MMFSQIFLFISYIYGETTWRGLFKVICDRRVIGVRYDVQIDQS